MPDARASQKSFDKLTLGGDNGVAGSSLTSIGVADDGQWLAAGGVAGVVGVWHAPTRRLATSLVHDNGGVGALAFVPRGEVSRSSFLFHSTSKK